MKPQKTTLALIIGTRDFFPAEPVREGRSQVIQLLNELGVDAIYLDEQTTRFGPVETFDQVKKCAALFHSSRKLKR